MDHYMQKQSINKKVGLELKTFLIFRKIEMLHEANEKGPCLYHPKIVHSLKIKNRAFKLSSHTRADELDTKRKTRYMEQTKIIPP
jgi:hypothetical protein